MPIVSQVWFPKLILILLRDLVVHLVINLKDGEKGVVVEGQ